MKFRFYLDGPEAVVGLFSWRDVDGNTETFAPFNTDDIIIKYDVIDVIPVEVNK